MESSGSLQHIKSRTQIEMLGVAEDDLGLDVLLKVSMIYALYRAYSAHRHEYRRLYLSMVRGDHTAAGRRLGVVMRLYELHSKTF